MFAKLELPMRQPWQAHYPIASCQWIWEYFELPWLQFAHKFCSNSSQVLDVPFFFGGTSKISWHRACFNESPSSHQAFTLCLAIFSCFTGEDAALPGCDWICSKPELIVHCCCVEKHGCTSVMAACTHQLRRSLWNQFISLMVMLTAFSIKIVRSLCYNCMCMHVRYIVYITIHTCWCLQYVYMQLKYRCARCMADNHRERESIPKASEICLQAFCLNASEKFSSENFRLSTLKNGIPCYHQHKNDFLQDLRTLFVCSAASAASAFSTI